MIFAKLVRTSIGKVNEQTRQLAADSGVLLEMEYDESSKPMQIASSDWVQDYLPIFGKGNYIVLEIPTPDLTNGSNFTETKINSAIEAIPKMKKEFLEGEWGEVIEKSRPIWELVKEKDIKNKEANALREYLVRSGFSEEAVTNLLSSFYELFHFTSKFLHKIDPSGKQLNPEIIASKEDAYLIYSLSINIIHLIAKKINKVNLT